MRVETVGPKTISVGKESTYRVRLVNQGSASAERVAVTVTLPGSVQVTSAQARLGSVRQERTSAGGKQVVWDLDQVAGGAQHELAIAVKPTENRPIDLRVDWVFRPASLAARIEVQQPQLAMAIDGPLEMRFGETKVFKVRLSNPGNGPAENVTVNIGATAAASQPNSIGTLAAGETRTMEVELTARQAGAMRIRATARGDGGLQAESSHEVRVRRAELAVNITAPQLLYAGTTATYEIRVTNRGDATADEVVLQLNLPAGAKNGIGLDKKPITVDQPRWRLGNLTAGSENVYRLQCDLNATGQNQLVAQIQAADKTQASDTALTVVESIADLKLVVNDPKGPVPVGKDVVFEIQVVNRGSKEATNIELVAQFSDGIEPSAAQGHASEIVPGQVIFKPLETLPAGGQLTVKITARAAKSGNHQFRAELKCSDPETRLVSEESTRFFATTTGTSDSRAAEPSSDEPTPARR